jgi:hypothetical protein
MELHNKFKYQEVHKAEPRLGKSCLVTILLLVQNIMTQLEKGLFLPATARRDAVSLALTKSTGVKGFY